MVAGLVAGLAVPGFAQAQKKPEDKCGRTSATGYSDTPILPRQTWRVHDIERPKPQMVTPGEGLGFVKPPSDAVVLFDGKDLSKWYTSGRGKDRDKISEAGWKVENGYMEVEGRTGTIFTKEEFGDIQLHIEWASPGEVCGTSQWRGNSGVLLMGFYEIQVLDSWVNPTYADGQAGSIYGQWPPLVNASRKPGVWQAYDIIFEAPKFDGRKLLKPAYMTIFHNGVLMQHRQEVTGRMTHKLVGVYTPHGEKGPLGLQDHDTAARFRNIWVRPLKDYDQK